jgi:hypothetical protein
MKKPAKQCWAGGCRLCRLGLWFAVVGDLQFHTILAITLGWGIGGGLFGWYQHWKSSRREITLSPDGKGGFQDNLIRKEKVFWWIYAATILIGLAATVSMMNGYI